MSDPEKAAHNAKPYMVRSGYPHVGTYDVVLVEKDGGPEIGILTAIPNHHARRSLKEVADHLEVEALNDAR